MDTRYEEYPPVFGGLMKVYLVAPEPVDKNRRSIVEDTKPQWRAIAVPCIAIQVLPIDGTRKEIICRVSIFSFNAFMAFARSLHAFNRSKKMNCKLSCKAVYPSIASKALVMDQYTVQ